MPSLQHHNLNKLQSYSLSSNSYISLTLGASGSTYTAPADGWFFLRTLFTSTSWGDAYASLSNTLMDPQCSGTTGISGSCLVPVLKNEKIVLNYYNMNTSPSCKLIFVYAVGSAPQS